MKENLTLTPDRVREKKEKIHPNPRSGFGTEMITWFQLETEPQTRDLESRKKEKRTSVRRKCNPNPNFDPHTSNWFNPNTKRTKSDGEEGEGVVYLTVRWGDPLPAREKKTEPGELFARARPKKRRGQAARRRRAHPLGSAHADEGAGDGAMAALSAVSPARVTRWLLLLR